MVWKLTSLKLLAVKTMMVMSSFPLSRALKSIRCCSKFKLFSSATSNENTENLMYKIQKCQIQNLPPQIQTQFHLRPPSQHPQEPKILMFWHQISCERGNWRCKLPPRESEPIWLWLQQRVQWHFFRSLPGHPCSSSETNTKGWEKVVGLESTN